MIDTAHTSIEGHRIAEALQVEGRIKPAIVIATYDLPAEIDPERVARETESDVYVLDGYQAANGCADALPEGAGVYVKRGDTKLRVYPTDLDWLIDPMLSRFFPAAAGSRFGAVTMPKILEFIEESEGRATSAGPKRLPGGSIDSEAQDKLAALMVQLSVASDGESQQEPEVQAPPAAPEAESPEPVYTEAVAKRDRRIQDLEAGYANAEHIIAGLQSEIEKLKSDKTRLKAQVDSCRCHEIDNSGGSPSDAIRQAEASAAKAVHEASEADERAQRQSKRAERAIGNKNVNKLLDEMDLDLNDVFQMLIWRHWHVNYSRDDKAHYPLQPFALQAPFAKVTVESRGSVKLSKIIETMTDVVCDKSTSRLNVHAQRESASPQARDVADPDLGTLNRAYLENNTAAARRLLFWKKSNAPVSFHSVLGHDTKVTWPLQK